MVKSSLTQYGTYGFLSALLAAQISSMPRPVSENAKKQLLNPIKRLKTKAR